MRSISVLLGTALFAWSVTLYAQPWQFNQPVDVTSTTQPGIFHHLESSGRRNVAVSDRTVAIAWEDNRNNTPAIYLARKQIAVPGLFRETRISGPGEAYEPSLVALGNNRFAIAWEENASIHVRLVSPEALGPVIRLGDGNANQASLATAGDRFLLVYSRLQGRHGRIYLQQFATKDLDLKLQQSCPVDPEPASAAQLYPTAVSLNERIVVAWEDRRPGHTIIMAARSLPDKICRFSAPQRISEQSPGPRPPYGKGHGVARVAMARYANHQLLAAWADKRDFREGYDIYASSYPADGDRLFSHNIKVQDPFGGVAQQWHPSVAGHASGAVVVAWDDNRDGDANIMLSWKENDGWSDDIAVPGASGAGEQNHPSVTLDDHGNLHLAWIERQIVGGPTRVRYLYAPRQQ